METVSIQVYLQANPKSTTYAIMKQSLLISLLLLLSQVGLAQKSVQSGPMLGSVEMREAKIWLQTTEKANVEIRYWKKENPDKMWKEKENAEKKNVFVTHFVLENLDPDTEYGYQILVDNREQSFDYPLTFKTQSLWQWRTDPPEFTVAIGSCLFINEPEADRPGKGYGDRYDILERIADLKPNMMLWLGDNVYYREPDFYSKAGLVHRNTHTRSVKELQRLLAGSINIASWDDHDFGPNNSDRSYRMREEALDLFKLFWMNPNYGTGKTKGVFGRYLYNDIEFFILDDRYHRAPNRLNDPDKAFFGREQIQWLKDALSNSRAPFKVVVSGSQVINEQTGSEAFSRFENEYKDLMAWLDESKVEGVLFLSGDRHHTEVLKKKRPGLYPLYDFTSSPLTAGTHDSLFDLEKDNPMRVDGTLLLGKRNFGTLTFSGPRTDRMLTMHTYDNDGKQVWELKIKASELEVPKN